MSIDKSSYIDYFRQYLETYVKRMFNMNLTYANLPHLFSYSVNERHHYPLYFIWLLPEYREWYEKNDKCNYIMLGKNFTYHMTDIFYYNSYVLNDIYSFMNDPFGVTYQDIVDAKLSLGWKLLHILEGCQKFLWSFVSTIERVKNDSL
jgi:hypothetical protein